MEKEDCKYRCTDEHCRLTHLSYGGTVLWEIYRPELLNGVRVLKVPGIRTKRTEDLYSSKKPEQEPVTITAIPYYAWGNRGLNEMRVWLPEA